MAKERAVEKDKSRKREKKVSDDKVTKTKKQKKKRAATPSDASSDDESTGGVSVNAEAVSHSAYCPLTKPESSLRLCTARRHSHGRPRRDRRDWAQKQQDS
jgi:hypothetical protein